MKQTITQSMFIDAFKLSSERSEQFSYEALEAIFEHITSIEDDCGNEIEFDMIAICCEFTEFANALDCAILYNSYDLDEESEEQALEWLEDRTQVIKFDGGIVVGEF